MPVENFTTYTEVDPSGWITVTSSRITFASLRRNADAYVYSDKGVNNFDGDFTHLLTIRATANVDFALVGAWALTNDLDDALGLVTNNKDALTLFLKHQGGASQAKISLTELDGGTEYFSSVLTIQHDTDYYLKIVRDESAGAFGTLYCYVYTDADRTNLFATLSVALHSSKKDFRYFLLSQSWNSGSSYAISGYVENLDISFIPGAPTVTTQECTDTTALTSTGHGLYTTEGDSSVTQHGHVWDTSANPTTSDSSSGFWGKTENGAAPNTGSFTSAITGLTPGTLYYVAAYAINSEGTDYGSDVTITTGTTIQRAHIWSEGKDFHYFDEHGVERVLQGHAVASDKDILPWLDPWS